MGGVASTISLAVLHPDTDESETERPRAVATSSLLMSPRPSGTANTFRHARNTVSVNTPHAKPKATWED